MILVQIFYIKYHEYVMNVNTLCTTFNAEPNSYIDLKNDVPKRAVYFTNDFLIVIHIS